MSKALDMVGLTDDEIKHGYHLACDNCEEHPHKCFIRTCMKSERTVARSAMRALVSWGDGVCPGHEIHKRTETRSTGTWIRKGAWIRRECKYCWAELKAALEEE